MIKIRYWNIQNKETGIMMMAVSTTNHFVAVERATSYVEAYPGYHFDVMETDVLEHRIPRQPMRVFLPPRGPANDNGAKSCE